MPAFHVCDVFHLVVADLQQFCQLLPVGAALVEHDDELAVRKHRSCRMALQQVVHVLRNARTVRAVFAHAFPERKQEVGAVLVLEQQIDLINEDICRSAAGPVGRDPVENAVQDGQHADGHHLAAEIQDVETDEPVADVHVCLFREGAVRAGREHLDLHRQRPGFLLFLPVQFLQQIDERRRIALVLPPDISGVDPGQAPVDDGLLKRAHVVASGHLLEQRHHELRLQGDRVRVAGVVRVDVQRVDMVFARRRQLNDLSVQRLHQRLVFPLGIGDDHVRVVGQQEVDDLLLCREGFARTGHVENEAVAVEQVVTVDQDHVLGDDVYTLEHAAAVLDLLHLERHEDRKAFRGQRPPRRDPVDADGQRRVEAVELLVFQRADLAHVLSARGGDRLGVGVELLKRIRRVQDRQDHPDHLLVTGRDVIQEFPDLLALLFHVIGDDGRVVVVGVLLALVVGDVCLNAERLLFPELLRLLCGNRNDVIVEDHVPVAVRQVHHHTVLDI